MARPAIPVNYEARTRGLPVHRQPGPLNEALSQNKKWTQDLDPLYLGEAWPRGQLLSCQGNL